MKTIGLIGGLSWESTSLYYKHINTLALTQYNQNAKLVLYSMDFGKSQHYCKIINMRK